MDKTFTYAGVSRLKGEMKARFANDSTRVKVLQKNGHQDIDLVELPYPMTKNEGAQYLLDIQFYQQNGVDNQEVKAALEAELEKKAPKTKAKADVIVETKVETKVPVATNTQEALDPELEEQPF